MFIVPDQDIEIFAKSLLGRHGPLAWKVAQERADALSAIGDEEGKHAWSRVVDTVRRLDTSRRVIASRPVGVAAASP